MRRWVVIGVLLAALMAGCTFSQGDGNGEDEGILQVVTATLSDEFSALAETLAATQLSPEQSLPEAGPTLAPSDTLIPSPVQVLPATVTPAAVVATETVPAATATAIATTTATLEQLAAVPSATPTLIPSATATATVTPTASITFTATEPPPPTFTPQPTLSLTPVPTRTPPGPTAVIALDDGSGNAIAGTGNDKLINPIAGVDSLPNTLYYLSDVGDVAQVFRLRIGLNHPDQLTFSDAGVAAFSVAANGTLAYITPQGALTVGAIPAVQRTNPDGTQPQVTALAWSPGGDWLAYTVSTPGAAETASETSGDGVWMLNREGTVVQLAATVYGDGPEARIYSGPIHWRADGTELMVKTTMPDGTPFTALDITSSQSTPLWNDVALLPDLYTDARWNVNDNAIITGGTRQILRVDPGTLNVTILLTESMGLVAEEANQWVDGTVMFIGHAEDGSARLYSLAAGTSTPRALTDVLTTGGRMEYLWDDTASEMLVAVYDGADQVLGTAYWRSADGVLHDLSALTGAVGAPQWGPVFQRNDWARISTTDGEALNVRATPSLQGEVLIRLITGSRVAIIGGPRIADGYRWWQVRAADGASGWVVESVLDARGLLSRTLIPID